MPNWTQNVLTIAGEPDDLRTFLQAVNWPGMRTEIDSKTLDEGIVTVAFDTAWRAPVSFFYKLREAYPHLALKCQWRDEEDNYDALHSLEYEAAA